MPERSSAERLDDRQRDRSDPELPDRAAGRRGAENGAASGQESVPVDWRLGVQPAAAPGPYGDRQGVAHQGDTRQPPEHDVGDYGGPVVPAGPVNGLHYG